MGFEFSGGDEVDAGEEGVWSDEEDDGLGFVGFDICGLEEFGPSGEVVFCWAVKEFWSLGCGKWSLGCGFILSKAGDTYLDDDAWVDDNGGEDDNGAGDGGAAIGWTGPIG